MEFMLPYQLAADQVCDRSPAGGPVSNLAADVAAVLLDLSHAPDSLVEGT